MAVPTQEEEMDGDTRRVDPLPITRVGLEAQQEVLTLPGHSESEGDEQSSSEGKTVSTPEPDLDDDETAAVNGGDGQGRDMSKSYAERLTEPGSETSSVSAIAREWIGDDMSGGRRPGMMLVGSWNVARKLGTGASLTGHQSPLDLLMDEMEELDISFMSVQEPGCPLSDIRRRLRDGFRVHGSEDNARVVWISRGAWSALVRAWGDQGYLLSQAWDQITSL